MEKLKLELEELAVTSFDTASDTDEGRGTVEARAFDPTHHTGCPTCRTLCLPYC